MSLVPATSLSPPPHRGKFPGPSGWISYHHLLCAQNKKESVSEHMVGCVCVHTWGGGGVSWGGVTAVRSNV